MAIILGKQSLDRLSGVHKDLVRVVRRAAALATPRDDFAVLEGVRAKEKMWENWGKGRTAAQCSAKGVPVAYARPDAAKVTWLADPLMSNHRKRADGFGHAVDLIPWPLDWSDTARFDRLALIMFRAAAIESVKIRWGADWDRDGNFHEQGESDSPHFELV